MSPTKQGKLVRYHDIFHSLYLHNQFCKLFISLCNSYLKQTKVVIFKSNRGNITIDRFILSLVLIIALSVCENEPVLILW